MVEKWYLFYLPFKSQAQLVLRRLEKAEETSSCMVTLYTYTMHPFSSSKVWLGHRCTIPHTARIKMKALLLCWAASNVE